ncbi:MAG: zinc-ribbon domain-containing protein [Deltaproteobacteria bacterium]|jgi:predicted amidophosphoribosyltransferase|nr:zinc-ribbon domain-containing protein [Deltaproteobacteria bacterium]
MPLINCPDCGTQVSDSAPACPKCGRDLVPYLPKHKQQPDKKNGGCARTAIIVYTYCVIMIIVLYAI